MSSPVKSLQLYQDFKQMYVSARDAVNVVVEALPTKVSEGAGKVYKFFLEYSPVVFGIGSALLFWVSTPAYTLGFIAGFAFKAMPKMFGLDGEIEVSMNRKNFLDFEIANLICKLFIKVAARAFIGGFVGGNFAAQLLMGVSKGPNNSDRKEPVIASVPVAVAR